MMQGCERVRPLYLCRRHRRRRRRRRHPLLPRGRLLWFLFREPGNGAYLSGNEPGKKTVQRVPNVPYVKCHWDAGETWGLRRPLFLARMQDRAPKRAAVHACSMTIFAVNIARAQMCAV